MTVGELKAMIADIGDDLIVVMSSDSEGNSYSPLADVDVDGYQAETTWSGYVGPLALTDELRAAGYTEEDVIPNGVPALVLWPTN